MEVQEMELFGLEGKEMVSPVAVQSTPKTMVTPAESFVEIHPTKLLQESPASNNANHTTNNVP